eukprot:3599310-Rhodomonas_salina.2
MAAKRPAEALGMRVHTARYAARSRSYQPHGYGDAFPLGPARPAAVEWIMMMLLVDLICPLFKKDVGPERSRVERGRAGRVEGPREGGEVGSRVERGRVCSVESRERALSPSDSPCPLSVRHHVTLSSSPKQKEKLTRDGGTEVERRLQ